MNNRMIGLICIIAFFVVVPPTVWHDRNTDKWVQWVYDYQPLIAAAFAIFAAYLTINTMRDTDDRQEKRHQELMTLNLRRDQLVVRRAAHPQMLDFQDCLTDFKTVLSRIEATNYSDFIKSEAKAPTMHRLYRELQSIVERDQLTAVKPLLDHTGYRALQILRQLADQNNVDIHLARFNLDIGNFYRSGYVADFETGQAQMIKFIDRLRTICAQLPVLNESIAALVEEYT